MASQSVPLHGHNDRQETTGGGQDWIIPAAAPHAAVLAALQRASFGPGETAWPAGAWAGWLDQPGVVALLAGRGETPAGLALGRVVAGEAEVLTLAVAPPYRRAGTGRRLLAALLDGLAGLGAERVALEVAAGNRAAIALYEAAGFGESGRRPGYYVSQAGRADALIMTRACGKSPDR
jgi:ribosomal-protein-alanine N-acetyltransferase